MNPIISIVNESKTVSDADVKSKLPALQKQITRDFEPAWGWGANLKFEATKCDMKMVIRDHSREGDLGFHVEGGKPVGYVYAKDDMEDQREYTSTLSHELLEMIADPNANLYANGPFRFKGQRRIGFFAYEVCDPVSESYYKIDGVRVQDFVKPEWFEEFHKKGSMTMDHMGLLDAPFTLSEGGYIDVFSRGRWHSLTGPKAIPKRRRHRLLTRMHVLRTAVLPPG